MLNFERFIQLKGKNIYVAQDIDINFSIFKYTDLFNLLMINLNQFYVGIKKNFPDKLESGEEFVLLSSDFSIPRESISESQVIKSKELRKEIENSKYWLTACWTLKQEEDFFMWKTYAPNKFSVRIETTIKDLLNSINSDNYNIFVDMINYSSKKKCINDITDYAFYKYKFYEGEEELRIYFIPSMDVIGPEKQEKNRDVYLELKSPLPIKSILLSPFLQPVSKAKLKELLEQHFKIESSIIHSSQILLKF